jgi:hypothetical protein
MLKRRRMQKVGEGLTGRETERREIVYSNAGDNHH